MYINYNRIYVVIYATKFDKKKTTIIIYSHESALHIKPHIQKEFKYSSYSDKNIE